MSAGKYSSSSIFKISPTHTFLHNTSISHFQDEGLNFQVFLEFVSISAQYLLRSSYPSLKIDREITNIKGDIADKGFNGEIDDIDYNIALIKKYMFAYLLN